MARGSKNQVTLTFAGDSTKLEQAFDEVGQSAKDMGDDVKTSGQSFDRVGEATDALDTKAMGFRDTITGVQDSVVGFGKVLKGDFSGEALFTAGAGVGDLASGFTNLLVPSMKSAVTWLGKTKVGILAQAAASKVAGAATKVWAGIQAVFNAIMALNPVVLIILAITGLIAVIVLVATKTDFFQKLWQRVWSVIDKPVKAVWSWLRDTLWPGIQKVWNGIIAGVRLVWEGVKKYFGFWRGLLERVIGWVTGLWTTARRGFNRLVGFIKGLPGRIASAARGMFNGIRDAFRGAINWIIDRWNGLSFRIPAVTIPVIGTIGGQTLSTPNIPRLHRGGIVPGAPGSEQLAVLEAGERVTPAGGGRQMTMEVRASGGGTRADRALAEALAELVRTGAISLVVRNGRVAVG